jgi:serine/threonine protein kinase
MLRKKIGSFYLVENLGSDEMSGVFLGINPRTRERRAYKILGKRCSMTDSACASFLREVDIIRGLTHPGIIKVLDSGVFENCYYYGMEFMPGGSLARRMEHRKIAAFEALRLFRFLCGAMAYAHEHLVVHRNLKPSNVLFNAADAPVISEFAMALESGIGRAVPVKPRKILGGIAYLAPEQRFGSSEVNRRTDVFALGSILYEMLMGFPPLGNFPWPRTVNPDFPESLNIILENCLAANPEDRFEHAGCLQTELEECPAFAEGERGEITGAGHAREIFAVDDSKVPAVKTDRIESWLRILRTGSTRERLDGIREMVDQISPGEAKSLLKLYPEEEDRVRWGLIRVFGDLRIEAATQLILGDLGSPFHTECAIEALGKIGSDKAFNAILEHVMKHPESAVIALLPMARTGKQRAVRYLRSYLSHETADLRQAAVHALASIPRAESLRALNDRLRVERDKDVCSCLLQSVQSLEEILFSSPARTAQPDNITSRAGIS